MTPPDVPPTLALGPAGDELAGLVPSSRERFLLGITGAPGAGKSTLATHLATACGATVVPMDGFHLADVELVRRGIRDRKGAPETFDAWGYAALLARVRERPPYVVMAPGFERGLEQPLAGAVPVGPEAALVLTEGNYLLLDEPEWRAVRSTLDAVWHVRFGKSPAEAEGWVARVDETNARLVEASAHRADLVLDLTRWVP